MRFVCCNKQGQTLHFDMNSPTWRLFLENSGREFLIMELDESPYDRLVQFFFGGNTTERDLFVPGEEAVDLVATLKNLSHMVNSTALFEYKAGSQVTALRHKGFNLIACNTLPA